MTYTRAERLEQITALRERGLKQRELAAALGITVSGVQNILNDPDGTKQKARRERYRGECEVCGESTDGSNGRAKAPLRCRAHVERYWTRDRIIDAIQRWAVEHGEAPVSTDWTRAGGRDPGHPAKSNVYEPYGPFKTWNDAIRAAGFTPLPRGVKKHSRRGRELAAA